MKKMLIIFISLCVLMSSTACTLATIRSLDDDEEAKQGFDADAYVESIWDSLYMPTVMENSLEAQQLLGALQANREEAIITYGNRSGTGAYSFLIRGEAQVLSVDLESRIGLMAVDFAPFDGEADANIAIGPVIRRRNIATTDAVGFIQFNDFVNQTEFASVSDAIKNRILQDVITPLDLATITGKTIQFIGAFSLEENADIEIVPIMIEVQS